MKQHDLAMVTVGTLPEWYDEDLHDPYLENALEQWFGKVATQVQANYVYSGDHLVTFYNKDGDLVSERTTDLTFAFDKAKAEEW